MNQDLPPGATMTPPYTRGTHVPTRRTVLRALGAGVTLPVLGGVAAARETRTVVDFDGVGPENLAVDGDGNVYMTMDFSGELRRLNARDARRTGLGIDDTDLVATLDPGGGFITGIVEDHGRLFVALSSFDSPGSDSHGIWRISPAGVPTLLAGLDADRLPNGIYLDLGHHRLLVTDSFRGQVLSVDLPGGGVDVWADDELLRPKGFIGANGIDVDANGDVYVANLDHGRVIRIPMLDGGSAGIAETVMEDPGLVGADGLTFYRGQSLYVAVNGQDKVVRIAPSGRIHTVVDAADGLDFPADIAFGRAGSTNGKLWVANFALRFAPDVHIGDAPSLMLAHP